MCYRGSDGRTWRYEAQFNTLWFSVTSLCGSCLQPCLTSIETPPHTVGKVPMLNGNYWPPTHDHSGPKPFVS